MLETLVREFQAWGPRLLVGAETTVFVTVATMTFATIWGLFLGILRIARIPVIHQLLLAYVEIFRGLPTIVILFIVFFGLPSAGVNISDNPIVIGIFGLTLNLGAYLSEVFRAAILAVDPGQMEAAVSIGMSRREGYQQIVLPQAFLIAVPTLGSFFIGLLKDTSLLSFISVSELMRVGNDIVAATFLSFHVYFFVGVIYIILSIVSSRLILIVEGRLRPLEKRLTGKSEIDFRKGLPPDMRAA
jgi:His/Glu/Gln/Arg/opine family amino acid ABC transporter permease subunit